MGDLATSFDQKRMRSFSFDRNRPNTRYEKLSSSMRLVDDDESDNNQCGHQNMSRAWRFVSKLFSLKKAGGGDTKADRMTVRSSSWRPDPNCRWPVQGW
ncbi:hypothetical protein HanIR_Chr07g0318881 [Helianthus annuus]|nr:hypothetical protein HanIR_Chr07g0318881 [Helianthus annuus]